MAKLRIRIKLNPGRIGAPLRKLSLVSQDLHGFLRAAVSDLGLDAEDIEWIARDFENGSAEFTVENLGDYPEPQAKNFHGEVKNLVEHRPGEERLNGPFKKSTIQTYTKIGSHLDPDEYLNVGFFDGLPAPKEWKRLTKSQSIGIIESLQETLEYVGAVFGKINALYKESPQPYFNIRNLDTKTLVTCFYKDRDYDKIIEALRDKDAFVHVGGLVRANMINHDLESVMVDKIRPVKGFSEEEYKKLLGSLPDFTGDLSTEEFISRLRKDRD